MARWCGKWPPTARSRTRAEFCGAAGGRAPTTFVRCVRWPLHQHAHGRQLHQGERDRLPVVQQRPPIPRWQHLVGPGTWTDLAVAMLSGTEAVDHGDHLVLRTPSNPGYYWGNCIQVLDPEAADDAERWVARHRASVPYAAHVAIGLPREVSAEPYSRLGLTIEHEQALGTSGPLLHRELAPSYQVRALADDEDWDRFVTLFCTENERTGEHGAAAFEAFMRDQAAQRRRLVGQGQARFFGVFARRRLVAHCGMVRCADVGRYQSVLVDAAHRRQGLAAHLVGAAARWARSQGIQELVILADEGTVAEHLYRGLGFNDLQALTQAFRAPERA